MSLLSFPPYLNMTEARISAQVTRYCKRGMEIAIHASNDAACAADVSTSAWLAVTIFLMKVPNMSVQEMNRPSPRPNPEKPANAGPRLSRTDLNFIVDFILLINFCVVFWISGVLRFVFPAANLANGWLLWGQDYTWWNSCLFVSMCVLTVGILVHIMLHWTWVCGVVASRMSKEKKAKLDDGTRTLWGVILLVVVLHILGIALAIAVFTIKAPRMDGVTQMPSMTNICTVDHSRPASESHFGRTARQPSEATGFVVGRAGSSVDSSHIVMFNGRRTGSPTSSWY